MQQLQNISNYIYNDASHDDILEILTKLPPDCVKDILSVYLNTIKLKMMRIPNYDFGYDKSILHKLMALFTQNQTIKRVSSSLNKSVNLATIDQDYNNYPVDDFKNKQIDYYHKNAMIVQPFVTGDYGEYHHFELMKQSINESKKVQICIPYVNEKDTEIQVIIEKLQNDTKFSAQMIFDKKCIGSDKIIQQYAHLNNLECRVYDNPQHKLFHMKQTLITNQRNEIEIWDGSKNPTKNGNWSNIESIIKLTAINKNKCKPLKAIKRTWQQIWNSSILTVNKKFGEYFQATENNNNNTIIFSLIEKCFDENGKCAFKLCHHETNDKWVQCGQTVRKHSKHKHYKAHLKTHKTYFKQGIQTNNKSYICRNCHKTFDNKSRDWPNHVTRSTCCRK